MARRRVPSSIDCCYINFDMAIEHPPPVWKNQDIVLYHGTTVEAASEIAAGKIDLRHGRLRTDFGPGFYMTTIRRQASEWAQEKASRRIKHHRPSEPKLVEFVLNREELTQFDSLAFVDGQFSAEQFWSFVHYCRNGATDHRRTLSGVTSSGYYDVIFGPVSRLWEARLAMREADQISFHTEQAVSFLNGNAKRRMIEP
jgi:hypothetical protein